jgi:hypothetical protein
MPTSPALIEALNATTVLDAVNVCLKCIGEAPTNSLLEGGGSVDAESAHGTLIEASRQVQGLGWHFNKELGFKLNPEATTGFVRLPANTLRVDEIWPDDLRHGSDMVQRGLRLYDRLKHTYAIARPVTVDLIVMLPFEELPQYARTYITIRGARKFTTDEANSDALYKFNKADEDEALAQMEQMDAENSGANLAINSPFIRGMISR